MSIKNRKKCIEYKTCITCRLKDKWSNEYNHRLTNRHPALENEHNHHQYKRTKKLTDKNAYWELEENIKSRKLGLVKNVMKIEKSNLNFYIKRTSLSKQTCEVWGQPLTEKTSPDSEENKNPAFSAWNNT